LLGWRIDVKSEQRYANLEDSGYQALLTLTGVEEPLADQLFAKNVKSLEDMAAAKVEDLTILRAIDDDFAVSLIDEAKEILANTSTAPDSLEKPAEDGIVESAPLENGEDRPEVDGSEEEENDITDGI
jgi:N utilization substance protein A